MLRLLIDQNFDHDILRGIERQLPAVDYVTTSDLGMSETADPDLLAWAAAEGRVILTHDQSTMPTHIAERMDSGQDIFGVLIVPHGMPIGAAIEELVLIVGGSEDDEYVNRYLFLPL